jgi:hypothetical protein
MTHQNITRAQSSRIAAFDLLRGYFIVVIVLDHLWQYPSLWSLITGQGSLWITAAEGFIMISGFLIGYIRGYKGLKKSFREISVLLLKRAFMLYVWMVIVGMGYVYIEWNNFLPAMPYTDLVRHDYWQAFVSFATGGKPHVWIHFLYLYAIFLVIAIGAVWLLRRNRPYILLLLTSLIYLAGMLWDVEWMKWQMLFFLPSVVGFYFEGLRNWWNHLQKNRRSKIKLAIYLSAFTTVSISTYLTFSANVSPITKGYSWAIFSNEVFSPAKIIMAALWFTALALLFNRFAAQIQKATAGTLEYIGQNSLTAYIIHGYVICLINWCFYKTIGEPESSWLFIVNTLLGAITVAVMYLFMRLPIVKRVIPR